MDSSYVEIFALIAGVAYIILEIRQKSFMWVLGIFTSLASMWIFFRQGLYASFGLNVYYLATSFVGLWQWGRDRKLLNEGNEEQSDAASIHLNRLSLPVIVSSAVVLLIGIFALAWLMERFENPMSLLDASVAVLSAVATWWLVRSYMEQWWLWIVANALSVVLCISQNMWWMAVLYVAYVFSAAYGLHHWKNKGRYIS
ncbi:MAG: nicotinamide mononucleotide transporter [Bacteroidales bacterium]|nr:nicotinamide mononucleotide transporter [Bacteroidales bacterium]